MPGQPSTVPSRQGPAQAHSSTLARNRRTRLVSYVGRPCSCEFHLLSSVTIASLRSMSGSSLRNFLRLLARSTA